MYLSSLSYVALLSSVASAFPTLSPDATSLVARLASESTGKASKRATIGFDPAAQLVDVTGEHAWAAPDFAAGDQRGPCPGLNALANHGYLPRNGISSWTDIATVTYSVLGLGSDISSFLAFYGAVFDGSVISLDPGYSIGGPSSLEPAITGGLLGTPQGLSGSHNKYESDSSAARGDLYTDGNDYKVNLTRYNMLYNLSPAPGNYDLSIWSTHRHNMFYLSKNENPYFFYAPFAGVIAGTGGFNFPPRLMSNKSAEFPDNGVLDRAMLNSWFSISGPDDNLQYTYGYERIPDNFYRRAIGNEYTAELFFEDFIMFAEETPEMVSIGGNTGKPDSYAAIDLGNFTGGVYNGAGLLDNNGAVLKCFVFQTLLAAAPDILKGGYADVPGVMATLTDKVNTFLGDATCPQIETLNEDQFAQYPGANYSNPGSL